MSLSDLTSPPLEIAVGASLLLDVDGTLLELAERPDAVRVSAGLRSILKRLDDRRRGGLALISGRPGSTVRQLFRDLEPVVSGSHGMEIHYSDGRVRSARRPASLDDVERAAQAFAYDWEGVLVECKPLGVALHYRENPYAEDACRSLMEGLAIRHNLFLQSGKMVIEARANAGDKGTAIRELMANPPFLGTHPLFIGDDDTDEPGFATAAELGGAGIIVGYRPTSFARYHLPDVAAVLNWLDSVSKL